MNELWDENHETPALYKNPDAAKSMLEQMKQEITDIRYPLHKQKSK